MNQNDTQRDLPDEELLCDAAVFGLEATDLSSDYADFSEFDAIAAKLLLSETDPAGSPRPGLADRLVATGQGMIAPRATATPPVETPVAPAGTESTGKAGDRFAWAVAACVACIAVVGWLRPLQQPKVKPAPPLSVAEQRENLLESDSVVQVDWTRPGEDPAAVNATGDVVWDNKRQQGFMRFRGLDANDPKERQYQLWIIDGKRDPMRPVDGGVFDIPGGVDEVLIPITAKLQVFDPKAFAITIEVPGGVAVSDRERLPLLASVN